MNLYRLYDSRGVLLYIGIANNWTYRVPQHSNKPWFSKVRRVEIEQHNRDLAWMQGEERRQIIALRPKHNQSHNGHPEAPSDTPRQHILQARKALEAKKKKAAT